MPKKYNREDVINAVWRARGNVSQAADEIGCARRTITSMAAQYATVKAAIDDARADKRGELLNKAESGLERALDNGEAWAIRYVLKSVGRGHGWDTLSGVDVNADGLTVVVKWSEAGA